MLVHCLSVMEPPKIRDILIPGFSAWSVIYIEIATVDQIYLNLNIVPLLAKMWCVYFSVQILGTIALLLSGTKQYLQIFRSFQGYKKQVECAQYATSAWW